MKKVIINVLIEYKSVYFLNNYLLLVVYLYVVVWYWKTLDPLESPPFTFLVAH